MAFALLGLLAAAASFGAAKIHLVVYSTASGNMRADKASRAANAKA